MARKENKASTDSKQFPFLKLGLSFGAVVVFFVALNASAQNVQNLIIKGTVNKQINAQPNIDLVDRYGDAAADPAVADALRKAQGPLTTEQIKEKSEAYEALQNGVWKPGADPTMALMYGYVPPNMSPEQAAIMAQHLPKMPRMPNPLTPKEIARMAGEPESERTALEPASPYIPYPDSFAKAHGTRQLQRIPQQNLPGQMAGMRMPNVPGLPMMGFGPGMGNGTVLGLSREEIRAQNQRIAEECTRARYGPVNVPILQPGHNAIAEQNRNNASSKHVAESDHQSVVGLVDNNGNEITSIQYDPWGNHQVLSGGTVMPDRMYKGMFYLPRADLYLTPNRVYSPKLARWLSRDPLGETAGTNLYAFCGNDPINFSDPLGLDLVANPGTTGIPIGAGPEKGWSHLYGDWGGPGFTSGAWQAEWSNFPSSRSNPNFHAPVDPVDECFYRHDVCIHNASGIENNDCRRGARRACDQKVAQCLARVRNTYRTGLPGGGSIPRYWDTRPLEGLFNQTNSPNNNLGEYVPNQTKYPYLHFDQ